MSTLRTVDEDLAAAEARLKAADAAWTDVQGHSHDEVEAAAAEYRDAHDAVELIKQTRYEAERTAAIARGEEVPPHLTLGGEQ